jgi:hypothetical protein
LPLRSIILGFSGSQQLPHKLLQLPVQFAPRLVL